MAYWEMPINGRRWSWQPVSYELSVQNLSSDPDALFIPVGLRTDVASLGDAWFVQDGAAATNSLRDYTVEAYTLTAALPSLYYSADSPDTRSLYVNAPYWGRYGTEAGTLTAEAAAAYRAYVYDTYTALPESTLAAAQALCKAYGITPALYDAGEWRYLDLSVTADTIADTMAALCRYTVNPPQKPADADFATWFLNDARSGYCVHFATTATILLRSMGIPARYAEGYTVAASDYQQERDADGYIAIPDYRSHAWVEVFSPSQMEWIPVEVTPGYTNSAGQTTPEDNTAADTPAPAMPDTTAPDTSEQTPDTPTTPEADAPADNTQNNTPDNAASAPNNQTILLPVLSIVAVCFLAITVICLGRRRQRCKLFASPHTNDNALAAGALVAGTLRVAGVPPDSVDYAKLQRLLEKARFSQQGLTEDECREALRTCHAMLNALHAAQHGVKKALFCLRFGL